MYGVRVSSGPLPFVGSSFVMERSFPSVALINHNFKAKIGHFLVRTTPDDLIFNLKEKVKEERPEELSSIRRSDVRVWKTKGAMVINASTKNHA